MWKRFETKVKLLIIVAALFCANCAGEIWQDITFSQDGQLNGTDHFVQVFVHDTLPNTTRLAINGGQIGTVFTYDNSITTISGGTFRGAYYSNHPENNDGDNLYLAPYSSSIYARNQSTVIYNSGDLDYVNGGLGNSIKCSDYSHLIVNGGTCGITALKNTNIDIINGIITDITSTDMPYDILHPQETNCQFYLTGGTFVGTVFLTSNSQMHIYGYDFVFNSNGVINDKGIDRRVGTLNGRWQDSTPFEINFEYFFGESSYDHVVLVEIPEPAAVLLLTIGFIFTRLKKSS
jgi:hypothetical protein